MSIRRFYFSFLCIWHSSFATQVGILWARFQLYYNIKIPIKKQEYFHWRVTPSQSVKDYNVHMLFLFLQVDVVISPVLADAGDPQKTIARPVSVQHWEGIEAWNGEGILIINAFHTSESSEIWKWAFTSLWWICFYSSKMPNFIAFKWNIRYNYFLYFFLVSRLMLSTKQMCWFF